MSTRYRFAGNCEETIQDYVPTDRFGISRRLVEYECGSWRGGRIALCEPCHKAASLEYPQGWRGYPGDVCKHGNYTGGSGADYICGACEFGED